MPHRHGLEVLADLRAATPPDEYRPVLVLTADATWEARERALALGARDFLTKPFEATEVLLRVENLLEARTMHAEERAARERAEAAEARATLLAEWSRLLAASLDPAAALARLPELLVPRWACACATVARGAGGAPRSLASAVADGVRDAGAMVGALRARAAAALAGGPEEEDPPLLAAAVETADGAAAAIAVAGGGPGTRTLVEELASRAGLAAEHARLLAAAELATRERERLLAVVAHDLRDPLGAVATSAEMLAGLRRDDADPRVRAALATIHANAAAMRRLVEDLLDASSRRARPR
jgi:signal transduction histidine kinase